MATSQEGGLNKKSAWSTINRNETERLAADYMSVIAEAKTEREFVESATRAAEAAGFKRADVLSPKPLAGGGKLLFTNRGKNAVLVRMGKRPLDQGFNMVAAHVDAPRIDVKQNPLFESTGLGLFQTHYYGGIKKYQWVTIPLALHGIIYDKGGKQLQLRIGEEDSEPVFNISDILPHLGQAQAEKKMSEGVSGEALDAIVGHVPGGVSDDKTPIRTGVLKILADQLNIDEEAFAASELEFVPAMKPRDVGFDRGLILAYGHDDRICGYTALRAILDQKNNPERTQIVVLVDKEEIGSDGDTGMQSEFLELVIERLIETTGEKTTARRVFWNSVALSADVGAGMDPNYLDVFEPTNAATVGNGIVVTKFTGSRGKYSAHDASAETLHKIIGLLDESGVPWQVAEMGKVDVGGGGTIAKFLSKRGIETLDAGPALLSMHAPQELASKADLYACYLAYHAFLEKAR
ncbi:MAG: aminopeptidase [Candidatus Cryosericum sp.]|nr:aminopeptidase [bacterium]